MAKIKASTVVTRIVIFPIMLVLALSVSVLMFFRFIINFVLHGGECFSYTMRTNRDTILEVYELVAQDIENRKKQQQ
jgi:hypothetical protein